MGVRNPKYVHPGDLIRPKQNFKVDMWYDVVRYADGTINHMTHLLGSHMTNMGTVIAVEGGINPALLVWISKIDRLVWLWRRTVVIVQKAE